MLGRFFNQTRRSVCQSGQLGRKSLFGTNGQNFLHTLVLGEYSGSNENEACLSDTTYSAITAAKQLGNDNKISLFIASGKKEMSDKLANEGKTIDGVKSVICFNDECLDHSMPEFVSEAICQCQSKHSFSHIVAGLSSFSRDVMPRVAGMLDVSQISDVTGIVDENKFERSMYAGNAVCQVESKEDLKLLTMRLTSFQCNKDEMKNSSNNGEIVNETIDKSNLGDLLSNKKHISDELASNEGPSLQSASIVISGGRGMQNGENFEMLYKLASLFGDCAVGASRAAVDAGFVSNDLQVGQTGKVVAPNLYMAVGISGAIQHIAGMKDSKVIVAINKDEEAPIFSIADYGLKADLFEAVPQLTQKLEK